LEGNFRARGIVCNSKRHSDFRGREGTAEVTVFDYTAKALEGGDRPLADYRGQVLLVVNVASKCGFTPQYKGLEALYRKYQPKGFTILAFPCDQFGHQEPGSEAEIREFCSLNYDVTFPMFAKIEVNGDGAHPLYRYLKSAKPGILGSEKIKWNFTKFLVGRDGQVLKRYAPNDTPDAIEGDVMALVEV
jgi:glutathione peroxidase